MRAVLYTEDMEPITVLDMTPLAQQYLDKNGGVYLAVMEPLRMVHQADHIKGHGMRTVRIWREKFIRNGTVHWFLFTRDDENALLLKAVFLPGQVSEVQDKERAAFAKGFMSAWMRLGE